MFIILLLYTKFNIVLCDIVFLSRINTEHRGYYNRYICGCINTRYLTRGGEYQNSAIR